MSAEQWFQQSGENRKKNEITGDKESLKIKEGLLVHFWHIYIIYGI